LLLIERLLSLVRKLSELIHLRLKRLSLLRRVLALLVERVGLRALTGPACATPALGPAATASQRF
jgi:hypothetical protein